MRARVGAILAQRQRAAAAAAQASAIKEKKKGQRGLNAQALLESHRALLDSLSPAQFDKLYKAFTSHGKTQAGFITAKELGPLLRSLGDSPRSTELQSLIALVDADGNAVIDFQEFLVLVALRSQHKHASEEVLDAFRLFDPEGTGTVPVSVFRDAMQHLTGIPDAELDVMVEEALAVSRQEAARRAELDAAKAARRAARKAARSRGGAVDTAGGGAVDAVGGGSMVWGYTAEDVGVPPAAEGGGVIGHALHAVGSFAAAAIMAGHGALSPKSPSHAPSRHHPALGIGPGREELAGLAARSPDHAGGGSGAGAMPRAGSHGVAHAVAGTWRADGVAPHVAVAVGNAPPGSADGDGEEGDGGSPVAGVADVLRRVPHTASFALGKPPPPAADHTTLLDDAVAALFHGAERAAHHAPPPAGAGGTWDEEAGGHIGVREEEVDGGIAMPTLRPSTRSHGLATATHTGDEAHLHLPGAADAHTRTTSAHGGVGDAEDGEVDDEDVPDELIYYETFVRVMFSY